MWLENMLKIMHKGKCQMQIVSYMGRMFNVHIGSVCARKLNVFTVTFCAGSLWSK